MATGESTGPEERQSSPDGVGIVDSNMNSVEDQSASQVLIEPSPSEDHQLPPPPAPAELGSPADEIARVAQNALPSKVLNTSTTTANIPPLLPNAVIAIVQPTTRISSNYQRIPGNTTTTTKNRGGQGLVPTGQGGGSNSGTGNHYAAQRVLVTATGGGHSHGGTNKQSQQQQAHHVHHQQHSVPVQASQVNSQQQRVLSQVSYGPGIAIHHHCQPPPTTPAGAVVSVAAGTAATTSVAMTATPVWPIDPVFHFGPGFEPPSRPYCPAHEPQPQEHVVMFHVHAGVSVSFQVNGNQEIVRGPVTVPMVSQSGSPPIPMPMQVPPGHLMQQVVDENGTLRHVILSPAQTHQIHNQGGVQHHIHGHFYQTNGAGSQFYSAIPTSAYTGPMPPPPQGQAGTPTAFNSMPQATNATYSLVQQPPPQLGVQPPPRQQHSPSPTNNGPNSGVTSSAGPSQVAYHNKDERLQQVHKKLQKKLEKREMNSVGAANNGASSSPRKATNANGELVVQSTIPVSLVIGNKRNNLQKQIVNINQQQQCGSNYQQPHHNNYPPPQQQQFLHHHQQQQHMNNHGGRIVLNSATTGGNSVNNSSRKVVICKTSSQPPVSGLKKKVNGGMSTTNGNGSVGTSEDGEEGTSSSIPEDEEYQLDVDQEDLDTVDHQAGGDYDGVGGEGEPNSNNGQVSVDEKVQHIKEQLSMVNGPKVSEILSRSALLQWIPPPNSESFQFNAQDLFYEILLSDSAKYAKYKSIFKGQSLSCRIQDLKPGVEYSVCLRVHYETVQGLESPTTIFNTVPCCPDAPLPPKLISRTKHTLQLRWSLTNDNGSHIQHYVLEYDCGRGHDFVEVCRTKGKQYTLTKLTPSTNYRFRLYAINEYGKSEYSKIECFQTFCPQPPQPMPPTMPYATSSSLRLDWLRRASDKDFVLQIATLTDNGHGYLPCYTGPDTHYECTNLPRATGFLFRLKATNESGSSQWSPDVYYYTLPDPPGRPPKPQVKGKIHSSHFRIKWDPPADCGGAPINLYYLQISSGAAYEQVYVGPDTETLCDHLSPATTYQVRVSCEGPAGVGLFSEPCTVTTEPVTPCAPLRPQLCELGVYSAAIRWGPPDDNGGSPVLEFEVELEGNLSRMQPPLANAQTIVYRGKDMFCDLKQLLPGEQYRVQVRAYNRIGCGPWSDVFVFNANAAPPNTPKPPQVIVRSPTQLLAEWQEPTLNGSPILEYILEMSSTDQSPDAFQVAFRGLELRHDMAGLQPFSRFFFKLCAVNAAGTSNYSEIVEMQTPAGPPAVPVIHELQVTAEDVTLFWKQPETNGSAIISYNLEYSCSGSAGGSSGKAVAAAPGSTSPQAIKKLALTGLVADSDDNLEYTIENLSAETGYRIKLRAVNEAGCSALSSASKVVTLPHPPTPPAIECVAVAHNSLKLKWGEGKNVDFLYYYVDMSHSRSREYANVYSGNNFSCKVTKLVECTTYKFRIRAKADRAGMGPYSEDYLFQTAAALPQSIKAPRVYFPCDVAAAVEDKSSDEANVNCNNVPIEWQHSKNSFADAVEYILQVKRQDQAQDYAQVYRGPETKFTVENLDCGVEYSMRVCPVRMMVRKSTNRRLSKRNADTSTTMATDSDGSTAATTTTTNTDSRSSSCSTRVEGGGVANGESAGEGSPEKKVGQDCDNTSVELLGQWSPALNYIVPTRLQQLQMQQHQSQHSVSDHSASDHHHNHHPHNHIHHPHSHHAQHGHSSNNRSHHHHSHPAAVTVAGSTAVGVSPMGLVSSAANESVTTVSVNRGGFVGKLMSMYASRHNMSDAEKAMIYAVAFMLVAIGVAIAFDCIMGN